MISKETFSYEHIMSIKEKYPHLDPSLIERMIFAFGLLEALVSVELPFIFKGGTSLMLLLDTSYRLSTDIDIIVEPDININDYLKKAAEIYPFIKMEEVVRTGKNGIVKKHFKFYYFSPSTQHEIPILLDVLFEHHGYAKVITKEIKHDFLFNENKLSIVLIPSIESILADKLTAFAPHTTGIEYEYTNKEGILVTKYLEVIKQFLDVSKLLEVASDIDIVRETYQLIVKQEIAYRGLNISAEDALMDTFNMCLSIASQGGMLKEDYPKLIRGIHSIQNHVFDINFNGQTAVSYAIELMMFIAKLITNKDEFTIEVSELIKLKGSKNINLIKKIDEPLYIKANRALKMLDLI